MTPEEITKELLTSRRDEAVERGLHQRVMTRVLKAQRVDDLQLSALSRWLAWPILATAGAGLLAIALVANLQQSNDLAQPESALAGTTLPDGQFTTLLEARLAKPLANLQELQVMKPLEQELAALESDFNRLKPRLPWQAPPSAQAPSG